LIGWLLDTNVIAELISPRGSPVVKAWAASQDETRFYLSILTIGEYDKGIANLADGDVRRAIYVSTRDRLASRFEGRVMPVSDPVVRRWGAISGQVRRDTGHPPPVIDTLIAVTAVEHDFYFATRNTRDVRLCGAAIFNPWIDDPALFPLSPRTRKPRRTQP
jgi:predicted nucleic acid-binding protein